MRAGNVGDDGSVFGLVNFLLGIGAKTYKIQPFLFSAV
jgi:hypothetical protein